MKAKEKEIRIPDDPTEEICQECRRRTVELTLQAVGISKEVADSVLEKIEVLEHQAKILAAERARLAGCKVYTIAQARNLLIRKYDQTKK